MKSCVMFSRKELYGGLLTSKEIISIYVPLNLLSRHSLQRFCIRGAPIRVGKRGKQTTTKIAYTTFFQEENSFSQPTLRIWPSSGYKSRILRSSRMREGRMVERSSPSESWLSEAETCHRVSASDHSAIERHHHLITVPLNDITIWSQCHRTTSPSDHSAIKRHHHLITVPLNDITIWSQCHWMTSPSDHSAIERHHHLITVPSNDITIWPQCRWTTSPSDHSAIERHHHLIRA